MNELFYLLILLNGVLSFNNDLQQSGAFEKGDFFIKKFIFKGILLEKIEYLL